MKKQLKFFFFLLFFLVFAYLLRPSSEHLEKLHVVKGISLAADYKQAVSRFLDENNKLPESSDWEAMTGSINVNLSDSAVEKITIGDNGPGSITIYYTSNRIENVPQAINDTRIILAPEVFGDSITWTCRGIMPPEYLPNACR